MLQLLGTIIGAFLFSRIFWFAAKQWPDKPSKAIAINCLYAGIVIPLDYLVNENVVRSIIAAICQLAILAIDLLWLHQAKPIENDRDQENWSAADKEAFKNLMDKKR
jgi:hypothetical protein